MSWLQCAPGALSSLEGVLQLCPELLRLYRVFYGTLWDRNVVPAHLLELCRLRIAAIHECEAEQVIRHAGTGVTAEQVAALARWRDAACFSAAERAVLAFSDKVPWQHHGVTDDDVAALREHLDDPQVVALTMAAVLFDVHCRWRLVFEVEPRARVVEVPAAVRGVLC